MNPVSSHPEPSTALSATWIAFRLARQRMALGDSGMVRLLAADLGSEVLSPGQSRLRRTVICLLTRSTSGQMSPASSPRLSE